MEDFSDELILYCFSFMPVSFVAGSSSVSRRFNILSCSYLCPLFQTRQEDGTYKPDPCKMFKFYHEFDSSLPIKALTLRTLKADQTKSLSCDSFNNNCAIQFFNDNLFSDHPVLLYESTEILDSELFHLMITYKDVSNWLIQYPTEKLIDAVGCEDLGPMMWSCTLTDHFFKNEQFVRGELGLRIKLFSLVHGQLSKTLQALLEKGDVFDSRLNAIEVGPLELVTLADFANDEKAVKRALELSAGFIRSAGVNQLASAIECIKSTQFVIGILKMHQLIPTYHLMLSLVLYMRSDAEEIFRSFNDVKEIVASIETGHASVHTLLKLCYGIFTGMSDDELIPMCESLNEGQELVGSIAAFHGRSPSLLLSLREEKEHVSHFSPLNFNQNDCLHYAKLEFDLEDNILLLKDVHLSWILKLISVPKRLEYFNHMLENVENEEVLPVLATLNRCAVKICTDELYRKFIKRSILCGMHDLFGGVPSHSEISRLEIEREVKELVRSGIDCSKMFQIDTARIILGNIQRTVFEEVLSWENGFDLAVGHLCANNGESFENNTLMLIKLCLLQNIGFPIPDNIRPLVVTAISDLMSGFGELDSKALERDLKRDLKRTFDASKLDPAPSSFHNTVAQTILSQVYSEMVDSLGFINPNTENNS